MRTGELPLAVANYRTMIGKKPFWLRHSYNAKRVDQMRYRAVRSIGLVRQSRYHIGWSNMHN